MDPQLAAKRAEFLAKLEAAMQAQDALLERSKDIARHPGRFGWEASLACGLVAVPLAAVTSALADLTYVLAMRGGPGPEVAPRAAETEKHANRDDTTPRRYADDERPV